MRKRFHDMNDNKTLYEAELFTTQTALGEFKAAGTLCGHIDFVGPFKGTCTLSVDEVENVIMMLRRAQNDVLRNADPDNDPRLYG